MARSSSPAINMNVGEWNQNPTWEHFSSLVQATTDGSAAPNRTVRFHHVKAALYAGSIESFLNTTMHGHLKARIRHRCDSRERAKADIRGERGITQAELADKLGLAQPNVSDYERGILRLNAEGQEVADGARGREG